MTTESQPPDDSDWGSCPAGELQQLAGRLQSRHHQRRNRQTAVGVTCTILLVTTGFYAISHLVLSEPNFGGITCTELKQQADDYLEQKLDAETGSRIEAHLAKCEHCRALMSELEEKRRIEPPPQILTLTPSRKRDAPQGLLLAGSSP